MMKQYIRHKFCALEYHIGKNYRISEGQFDSIMGDTITKPCAIVGNIITIVFEEKQLLTSTVTGRVSHKTLGKAKKLNFPINSKCNKFDETKLDACKEFYYYWLEENYMKRKCIDDEALKTEKKNFIEYVGRKISNLKRVPNTLIKNNNSSAVISKEKLLEEIGQKPSAELDELHEEHSGNDIKILVNPTNTDDGESNSSRLQSEKESDNDMCSDKEEEL